MKVAVLKEKETFEMRQFPCPEPDEHAVLVKMEACAVCNATDTKLFKGTHALSAFPSIIGHEGVGRVVAVGEKVTKLKIGDLVLGGSFYTDGIPSLWGAYSEFGIVGEDALVIPSSMDAAEASLAYMLSEAINAVRIAQLEPEDCVLIIGAGAVGFSLLSAVKALTKCRVIMLDRIEEKLATASEIGADYVINGAVEDVAERIHEITKGQGVSRIFEAVGSQATYQMAFDLIRRGGVIIPFGMIEGTMQIPFRTLYAKEVQMRWCKGSGVEENENKQTALRLIQEGAIRTDILITSRIPFDHISDAFRKIASGNEIRVILTME